MANRFFYHWDNREVEQEKRALSNLYGSPIRARIPSDLDKNGRPLLEFKAWKQEKIEREIINCVPWNTS